MGMYVTEGIILKHQDFRDTDRLLTVYTREHGLIKAVAKASRKISSKLGGNLEPFIHAQLTIVKGRTFDTVAHVDVIQNFRHIKSTFEIVQLARYLSAMLDRVLHQYQRDQRIFDLISKTWSVLDSSSFKVGTIPYIRWYFLWHLMSALGYHPELFDCAECKKKIRAERNYFSFKKGGLIDTACQAKIRDGILVSSNAIKAIRLIVDTSIEEMMRVRMGASVQRELDALTAAYLNYTQERELIRR